MNHPKRVTIQTYSVPSGTDINCKTCGCPVNMDNYGSNMWSHPCFLSANRKTHIFQFDEKYRLYTLPISALNKMDPETRELILRLSPFRNNSNSAQSKTSIEDATISDSDCFEESGFFEENETVSKEMMPQDTGSSEPDEQLVFYRKLIKLIREDHKGIWDHVSVPVENRTKLKILGMWVKMANELGVDYQSLQKIWASLKKQYQDAKDKKDLRKAPSGNSANSLQAVLAHEVDFPLFQDMTFLDDVREPIPTTDSLPNSETNVHTTIDKVQQVTGKTKSRKRSKGEAGDNDFSIEREILSLLKENKDPEDERLIAITLTVKTAMRRIPEEFWLRVQGDLITFFNNKIEEYSTS